MAASSPREVAQHGEAHGRALARRLDDQGQAERLDLGARRGPHLPIGGRNAGVRHQPLGDVLVHRQQTPDRVAPGVAQVRQLEQGLDAAALALPSVEHQEEQVGAAHLVESEEIVALVALAELVELLGGRRHDAQRRVEPALLVLAADRSARRCRPRRRDARGCARLPLPGPRRREPRCARSSIHR